MSIVVIGVNHRTGPLSVLERLTVAPDDVAKSVVRLAARDDLREVAVLSTCNRIEIYAVAERFHGAYADIRDFLCEVGDVPADELHPYLYSQHDAAAARHLFEVAAGLDSAVLGESEILGQVRGAWQTARSNGGVRSTLDLLFRHALRNALLPVVTRAGMLIPVLVGATAVIESVFAMPGLGRLAVESALSRDYPTILTLNFLAAGVVLLSNLLVDVCYVALDPRIRLG